MPDEEAADEFRRRDVLRRGRGAHLIATCPGNWRLQQPVHYCRGCCRTREDAVQRVYDALLGVGFQILPTPCRTKWLSMWPLVCDFVVMASFHNVYVDAVRYALQFSFEGESPGDEEGLSDLS
eukprot:3702832-Lingulodinium_polyedra.AAC.1